MEDFNVYLKKEEKEKVINVIKKAIKGELNRKELIEIFPYIVNFCKNIHFSDSSLSLPEILIKDINENVIGNYNDFNNTLTFSSTEINKILNDKDRLLINLLELFSTIGHEMMHYSQNDTAIKISNLSNKSLIDEKASDYVSACKNDFYLTKQEIKIMHELASPFIDDKPLGYENLMDYYSDVSFALYSVLFEEKEARDFECDFLLSIEKLVNNTSVEDICNKYIDKLVSLKRKSEDEKILKCNSIIENFKKLHDLSVNNIIEIAKNENIYFDKIGCSRELYEKSLKLLIDNKNNSQKLEILKISAYNIQKNLFNITIDSLINSVGVSKTQNIIYSLLSGEMNSSIKPNEEIYKIDYKYNNLLKQNQFEMICEKLLNDNNFSLFNSFITSNYKYLKKISIDELLKYLNIVNRKDSKASKERYINSLFNSIGYDKKIELIKSKKLDYVASNIMKNILLSELDYIPLKTSDIDKLFSYNTSR